MKNKKWVPFVSIMVLAFLGACGMNNNDQDLGREARNNMTEVNYENGADRDLDRDLDMDMDMNMNNGTIDGNDRMEVADEAADRVTALREVESATVLISGDNAYVAAMLEGRANQKLTDQTERKISDAVRKTDPQINDVFVSTNPNFVDRMTGYADEIEKGNPVSGFFEEFNETVRRIFPTNR
jgi:spore cortex protein